MGAKRVGQRIHVYWADETAWFSGVVQRYSASQGYYVVYDDGDERWEGLNESYRFEGQQSDSDADSEDEGEAQEQEQEQERPSLETGSGAEDEEHGETDAPRGATPRAIEPPTSDEDDHSETDDDGGGRDDEIAGPGAIEMTGDDEGDDEDYVDEPRGSARELTGAYPKPVVLDAGDDEDGGEDTNSEEGQEEDETRSVALTEVPTTHEPPRGGRPLDARRAHPLRGVLRGIIVCATNLPNVTRTEPPCAFTRVAFVEGATSSDLDGVRRQPQALMLRCKQTLAATQPVAATNHPLWNDLEEHGGDTPWDIASSELDGLFQLQVAPPMLAMAGSHRLQPAWQQIKGDVLFSVYHQDADAEKRADFIGQASLPLRSLILQLLHGHDTTPSMKTTQYVPLETRQGKPIGGGAELTVKFQFEPECAPVDHRPTGALKGASATELRQPAAARVSRPASVAPSVAASSKSRPLSATSTRVGTKGAKQQPPGRSHQSSSEINRRKFEKKLETENKAMAKRMAEQRREAGAIAARRQQLNHQPPLIKSEPKPGIVAVKTAPPRSHKASSAINRNKFVDQVKQENKSMGKRLIERVGLAGRDGAKVRPADAKGSKDESDWSDDKAQDKAHGADRRRVLLQEKDYLLEKAQAKYQQQHELVEQVMALQTQVADWKTKLFTVKSALQRVDAMNTKDTHVRDCLRRATEKTKRATPLTSSGGSSTARLEQLLENADEDSDEGSDSVTTAYKQELRELLLETTNLESEQRRLEDQSVALSKQEAALETEILELHRKWQFVEAKRAFQAKMAVEHATPASAVYTTREMRSKKQAMELSTEEEEQYAIFQAQEELTQLQIAATVLRDRVAKGDSGSSRRLAGASSSSSSSSAVCEQLQAKIAKRQAKLEALEAQQSDWRRQYEKLVVDGEYDALRAHAQELQHLLFLCQSEAKHVAAAERVAQHSRDKKAVDLQKQRFQEQTETEILLKSGSKAPKPR